MKLISKQEQANLEGVSSGCMVVVRDSDGQVRSAMLPPNPTNAQIHAEFPEAPRVIPATKAGWIELIRQSYADWQMAKTIAAEATANSLGTAQDRTALNNLATSLRNAMWADIQAWRDAT